MDDIFEEVARKEAEKRLVEQKAAEQLGEGVPDLPITQAPTIEEIISRPKPKISPEDAIKRLASIAIESKAIELPETTKRHSDVATKKIRAVLWLLGASNRQLARHFNVTVASIKQAIRGAKVENEPRRFQPTYNEQMSLEEFSWYARQLNSAPENILQFSSAKELYGWVLALHPYQGD